MGKDFGVKKIAMYCDMVREDFAPLIRKAEEKTSAIEDKLKVQVEKDFGIYEKLLMKTALMKQIEDIDCQIRRYTRCTYIPEFETSLSLVDIEIRNRIGEIEGTAAMITRERDKIIRKIKMSSATADVINMFDSIAEQLKEFTIKVNKIPKIEELSDIKAIEV